MDKAEATGMERDSARRGGRSAGRLAREPLHGLAVFKSVRWPRTGATRSLRLAAPALRDLGTHLHFVAARSLLHLLPSLTRSRRFQYDFVLFNGLASIARESGMGYYLWRGCQALGKPVFVYWHETDWVLDRHGREDPPSARRVARLASHPETVHFTASDCGSQTIRRRYPGTQPVAIYECASVPTPFDQPVAPGEPPLVLNIASIQERKGTDLFVDTAIKVCQRHSEVEFVWLGEGQSFGTWQADVERAGMQRRILFPGYVEAAYLLLRRASILFLSSRDDPFPLSVLEAMCLGRTIVAFDIGGAPEALGGGGTLIAPFDTDLAAEAILRHLSLPPQERMRPELRNRYLDSFTPERFAARLDDVLRGHLADER